MTQILELYKKCLVTEGKNPSDGRLSTVGVGFPVYKRNLISFSQTFQNAYWDKTGGLVTVLDNSVTAPNGTLTATTMTEVAGIGSHHIHDLIGSFIPNIGTKYYMSVFFKQPLTLADRYIQLTFWLAGFTALSYANIDLQTGTFGTIGADVIESGVVTSTNGWSRFYIAAKANAIGASGFQAAFVSGPTAVRAESYTVVLGLEQSTYIYGAQMDTAVLSTYQRTN